MEFNKVNQVEVDYRVLQSFILLRLAFFPLSSTFYTTQTLLYFD